MTNNFFHFTPDTTSTAIGFIQDAHHKAYFPNWPKAELNLENFGDETLLSQDYMVVELRNAVMILRRALPRDEGKGRPPYLAMETRQILSKNHNIPPERFTQYCHDMAESIVSAAEVFHSPWVEGEIVDLSHAARRYHVTEPDWAVTPRTELIDRVSKLVEFSQHPSAINSSHSNLNIRFSNQTGLTLSVVTTPNHRTWAADHGMLVRRTRHGKKNEIAVMIRMGFPFNA